jgi:hypothetical protein
VEPAISSGLHLPAWRTLFIAAISACYCFHGLAGTLRAPEADFHAPLICSHLVVKQPWQLFSHNFISCRAARARAGLALHSAGTILKRGGYRA